MLKMQIFSTLKAAIKTYSFQVFPESGVRLVDNLGVIKVHVKSHQREAGKCHGNPVIIKIIYK